MVCVPCGWCLGVLHIPSVECHMTSWLNHLGVQNQKGEPPNKRSRNTNSPKKPSPRKPSNKKSPNTKPPKKPSNKNSPNTKPPKKPSNKKSPYTNPPEKPSNKRRSTRIDTRKRKRPDPPSKDDENRESSDSDAHVEQQKSARELRLEMRAKRAKEKGDGAHQQTKESTGSTQSSSSGECTPNHVLLCVASYCVVGQLLGNAKCIFIQFACYIKCIFVVGLTRTGQYLYFSVHCETHVCVVLCIITGNRGIKRALPSLVSEGNLSAKKQKSSTGNTGTIFALKMSFCFRVICVKLLTELFDTI